MTIAGEPGARIGEEDELSSILPDPYGHGFSHSSSQEERTRLRWEVQNARRLKAGILARNPWLKLLKGIFGVMIALMALMGVLAPDKAPTSTGLVLLVWTIPYLLIVLPQTFAVESAWLAMQARLSLQETGVYSGGTRQMLRAQPGIDRIEEGLKDGRRHNALGAVLATLALGLLAASVTLELASMAYNMALLVAMTCAIAYTFHSSFTSELTDQLGDEIAALTYHAPTNHPTELSSMLRDLVEAHLDPDTLLGWNRWLDGFKEAVLPGYNIKQAIERLLFILHLEGEEVIDFELAKKEISEFLILDKMDELLFNAESKNENYQFDWLVVQRLLKHAKAWQPSAFLLLDRLQNDLVSGSSEILHNSWRMDATLDDECEDGSGHLFITLNNQTFNPKHVRVEVITPSGEPESRTHRFELQPCPPPRGPIPLHIEGNEDGLDWVPRYLERGVVLWIGVAWRENFKGQANVQVILRDDDGFVLESTVIRTKVLRGEVERRKERLKNIFDARSHSELNLVSELGN